MLVRYNEGSEWEMLFSLSLMLTDNIRGMVAIHFQMALRYRLFIIYKQWEIALREK